MLTIRQRSMLSGFHYEVVSESGALLAELVWPNYVQARNARLKWHKPGSPDGDLKILMPQGIYRIGFEFLSRAFANDLRFFLQQGEDIQAMAEVLFPKDGIKRHEVFLRQPMQARLVRANHWTRARYLLEVDGQVIGSIEEPHWFSMKRQLRIGLPNDMPVPLQTFLAFLVINSAFR
ncbi:MAG: hypothetical protein C0453_14740 [Comamonadaceae bacterium]|nr:hypothetical protein [Comamonadaceae bacterium]